MADLPSTLQRINDLEVSSDAPITEALLGKMGSSINGLIDRRARLTTLTFSANSSWQCPVGVTEVMVIGCGGGGGGGSASLGTPNRYGEGGGSGRYGVAVVSVTPGQTYSVTIGAGGAAGTWDGGTATGRPGGVGGTTSFGGLVSFAGGRGGRGTAASMPFPSSGESSPLGAAGVWSPNSGGASGGIGAGGAGATNNTGSGGAGGAGQLQLVYVTTP